MLVWLCAAVGLLTFFFSTAKHSSAFRSILCGSWVLVFLVLVLVEFAMIAVHGPDFQTRYALGRLTLFSISVQTLYFLTRLGLNGFRLLQVALVSSAALLVLAMTLGMAGFFSLGNETINGRSYFGVQIPFRKVTGFLMSDGRLGTVLVPAFLIVLSSIIYPRNEYIARFWRFPRLPYYWGCFVLSLEVHILPY